MGFGRLGGGRTRARTWDPLIKNSLTTFISLRRAKYGQVQRPRAIAGADGTHFLAACRTLARRDRVGLARPLPDPQSRRSYELLAGLTYEWVLN